MHRLFLSGDFSAVIFHIFFGAYIYMLLCLLSVIWRSKWKGVWARWNIRTVCSHNLWSKCWLKTIKDIKCLRSQNMRYKNMKLFQCTLPRYGKKWSIQVRLQTNTDKITSVIFVKHASYELQHSDVIICFSPMRVALSGCMLWYVWFGYTLSNLDVLTFCPFDYAVCTIFGTIYDFSSCFVTISTLYLFCFASFSRCSLKLYSVFLYCSVKHYI